MLETALRLHEVRKTFADHVAVDSISFRVPRGTIFGLLGRNGAGKTTTLRMIAGIFYPDSGSVEVLGRPWSEATRGRMAYLPEERGLYRKMRVVDQVQFFAEIKGKRGNDARVSVERVLGRFGLTEQRTRRIEELSKGNQQKVQLAGVLVSDPEILLLDEPMSGLDPVNVVLVRDILLELRALGKTVILSTHMMAEAEKLCDAVCLIHQGRIVLEGTVDAVRGSRGETAVHLTFEGDGSGIARLDGVERADVTGRKAEVRIRAGADTNAFLEALLRQVRVERFEVGAPSLEDVFVRQVGDAAAPEDVP